MAVVSSPIICCRYPSSTGNTVTPIDVTARLPGAPIKVGDDPVAIAITPNGKTAYVVDGKQAMVSPIRTSNNRAGRPIRITAAADTIAITPNGRTVYECAVSAGTSNCVGSAKFSRSLNFWILPDGVSGKSSTKSQWSGVLKAASLSRQ